MGAEQEEPRTAKVVSPQSTSSGDSEIIRLPVSSELNRGLKEERLGIVGKVKRAVRLVWEEETCEYHQETHSYPKLMSSASVRCHENFVYRLALKSFKKEHPEWDAETVEKKSRMAAAMEVYTITVRDGEVRYDF